MTLRIFHRFKKDSKLTLIDQYAIDLGSYFLNHPDGNLFLVNTLGIKLGNPDQTQSYKISIADDILKIVLVNKLSHMRRDE